MRDNLIQHTVRRGSALLIVIGTLALIAVFAAVYISIGRTDRRSANALQSQKDRVDSSMHFANHLKGIIAIDRLESVIEYGDSGSAANSAYGLREATDAPYTDYTRRSATSTNTDPAKYRFLPSGQFYSVGGRNGLEDYRVASDPWLASTTPTYLGNPGDPVTGTWERPFSTYAGYDPNFPNAKNFLDNRDWLQISNFAPDGRFVNLFNLRPNTAGSFVTSTVGSNVVGGFDAEPGVGFSPRIDGRPIRRMSNYLSLWKQEVPGDPLSLIQTHDPFGDNSIWVSGANDPVSVPSLGDLWNVPAVWTMNQRFMFMPLNQPFVTLNRNGDESSWADPDFPAYQYADADGDGMADSRWMELVAARDEDSEVSGVNREDIELFYDNEDFRYFIASRAIDLSSMVNVNTATDLLRPPSIEYPMGLTPADVDLRRLLTMQDQASDYTAGLGNSSPLSFGYLHRPYRLDDEPATGPWDPTAGAQAGFAQRHFNRNVSDYWLYRHDTLSGSNDLRELTNNSNAMLIGRYAYDGLRRGIVLNSALTADFVGRFTPSGGPTALDLREFERAPDDFNPVPVQITPEQRYQQYFNISGITPTYRASAWSRDAAYGSGLYGMDDLAELLTYFGLNDPDVTTRLERVTTGRYESPTAGGFNDVMQTNRLGPLMSNRPLGLDRQQHGIALIDINEDPGKAPSAQDLALREVNGRVSFNSMTHFALTPRTRMTTISGAVPLLPTEVSDDPSVVEGFDLNLSVAPDLKSVVQSTNGLFDLYTNALAGAIHAPKPVGFMSSATNWPVNAVDFSNHSGATLFYGHRGPELALRIAAHSAVNMKDLNDNDQNPSIATLVVDNANGANLRTFIASDMNVNSDPEYRLYPGAANGNVLDVGQDKLSTGSGMSAQRQLVNVYGFEPMPVLTEVSVMYMYTDAPLAAGGDEDWTPGADLPRLFMGNILYPAPGPGNERAEITIDNAFSRANPDFLGQVLAFQLHNPFGEPISLGGTNYSGGTLNDRDPLTQHVDPNDSTRLDTNSNYLFDYYIEYAGRFFKVAEYLEWYPTDQNTDSLFDIDDADPVYSSGGVNNPANDFARASGGRLDPGQRASGDAPGNQATYSNFNTRNVVLEPGETRVFYVIADRRFDDNSDGQPTRDSVWQNNLASTGDLPSQYSGAPDFDMDGFADGFDRRGWTGPAEEWVRHQLGVFNGNGSLDPVMMSEFDPETGELVNETTSVFTFSDLTTQSLDPILADASRNDATEVRLWKKVVTRGEETTRPASDINGVSNTTRLNLVSNDMLVDRVELTSGLTYGLPNSGAVAGTFSYDETFPDLSDPNQVALVNLGLRQDNTGLTIARWKTYRRSDSLTGNRPSIGQVTPWMVSSKSNSAISWHVQEHPVLEDHNAAVDSSSSFNSNIAIFEEGAAVSNQENEATVLGDYEIQSKLLNFLNPVNVGFGFTDGAGAIIQTLGLQPHLKDDVTLADSPFFVLDEQDDINRSLQKFESDRTLGGAGQSLDWEPGLLDPVPEILVNSSNIRAQPRLADLLLSWGISATYAPDPAKAADEYNPDEWITPWEAIGLALGYDNPTAAVDTDADYIWNNAYGQSSTKALFDNGHLVLDDYVSYLNLDAVDGFNPLADIRRGTGVPMALGVIDQARAVERVVQPNDPGSTPTTQEQLELALSRPTLGTININTAPIEVLRLLPGLTPSRAAYTGGATANEWWGTDLAGTNLPNNTTATDLNNLRENPDVAAAIVAYRDRTYATPNTASHSNPTGAGIYDSEPLNFGPTLPDLVSSNMRSEVELSILPTGSTDPVDRGLMTGIDGLRQTPGFGSLGELLAVRLDPEFSTTATNRWDLNRHLSIDQYGYDQERSGIDSGTTIMSQLFDGNPGQTVDDYAERLAMANNVLGTLSVRSDFFAVWFVVHGYQESDVANLRPEDPLVPTIRKRYLMVIDRSNVIEPGDEPRVLLMKELPI